MTDTDTRSHAEVNDHELAVDSPLRVEEIRIERHEPGTGHAPGDVPDDAFQEQEIVIPIRGEEAEVTKRARVREEVDISKDVRERDTLRREETRIGHDRAIHAERGDCP